MHSNRQPKQALLKFGTRKPTNDSKRIQQTEEIRKVRERSEPQHGRQSTPHRRLQKPISGANLSAEK
jgi:hypothetical protein